MNSVVDKMTGEQAGNNQCRLVNLSFEQQLIDNKYNI